MRLIRSEGYVYACMVIPCSKSMDQPGKVATLLVFNRTGKMNISEIIRFQNADRLLEFSDQ